MEEAVENGFKYLARDDRMAIAEYVLSLPGIDNRLEPDEARSGAE